MSAPVIAILGAGTIGQAVLRMTKHDLCSRSDSDLYGASVYIFDCAPTTTDVLQLQFSDPIEIAATLQDIHATVVFNCGPFRFNDAIARAAAISGCHYIDFTEDDEMSDRVVTIYRNHPHLTCATKCGLAPGFINYVGASLVADMDDPRELTVAVGALPRNVSGWSSAKHYALSWSVDGLVNEYIRPCNVKIAGKITQVPALSVRSDMFIDGVKYEMAYTSGGVGSLVHDLTNVPNVRYATIRYPGHYDWVERVVSESRGAFETIRKTFVETFPYTRDDVIVTYAEARGYDKSGKHVMNTYSNRFYGTRGLSGIQSTTAAGGVAVLELLLRGTLSGIVGHTSVTLAQFMDTVAYREYYFGRTAA